MSKSTPGPWHTGADGRIVYDVAGWAVSNAVTFHQRRQGDEDRANARLIAAAPELLEAGEKLLPENLNLSNSNIPDDFVVPLDTTMGELRTLAAAISKAKGGAS